MKQTLQTSDTEYVHNHKNRPPSAGGSINSQVNVSTNVTSTTPTLIRKGPPCESCGEGARRAAVVYL